MAQLTIRQSLVGLLFSFTAMLILVAILGVTFGMMWHWSSVNDCQKAKELYGMETQIYDHNCYVKRNGSWYIYNGGRP